MPLLAFPGGYGGLVQSDAGRILCPAASAAMRWRRARAAMAARRRGGAGAYPGNHRGRALALGDAELEGSFLSTGPIHPGIRTADEDGCLFTGNIAGEAHPVIAEGISMAIQSSGAAGEAADRPSRRSSMRGNGKRRFAPRIRAARCSRIWR
jgi:hypothetical protein